MSSITDFCMFVFMYYLPFFITVMIFLKVCSGAFLFYSQYDKWYLGIIPFAQTYYKCELSGTEWYWHVFDSVFGFIALYTFNPVAFLIWYILRGISDYKYASIFIDACNPHVYAWVPFAKYVIMVKEVLIYART